MTVLPVQPQQLDQPIASGTSEQEAHRLNTGLQRRVPESQRIARRQSLSCVQTVIARLSTGAIPPTFTRKREEPRLLSVQRQAAGGGVVSAGGTVFIVGAGIGVGVALPDDLTVFGDSAFRISATAFVRSVQPCKNSVSLAI